MLHTLIPLDLTPLLGPSWLSPDGMLGRFGDQMIWISMIIVFIECGLFFPFLPGDILLFFIGLFIKRHAAGGTGLDLNLWVACLLLSAAAFAGNVCGYEIGRAIGQRLYAHDGRIIKRKHLDQTHQFFEMYGNRALVLGRFVPVVRTYVTVVAGVTRMERRKFLTWSAVGAFAWAFLVTLLGYVLGYVRFLQDNIDIALLLIGVVPMIPMAIEYLRARRRMADSDAGDSGAGDSGARDSGADDSGAGGSHSGETRHEGGAHTVEDAAR